MEVVVQMLEELFSHSSCSSAISGFILGLCILHVEASPRQIWNPKLLLIMPLSCVNGCNEEVSQWHAYSTFSRHRRIRHREAKLHPGYMAQDITRNLFCVIHYSCTIYVH